MRDADHDAEQAPDAAAAGTPAQRLVTLRYRISLDDGTEVLSTFGGNPATLALGRGELAPALEDCIARAVPGERSAFRLAPGTAFGARREDLVHTLPRDAFDADLVLGPGEAIEFSTPGGERHVGMVQAIDATGVRVDFNHPLAGRGVHFEVELIGVLDA